MADGPVLAMAYSRINLNRAPARWGRLTHQITSEIWSVAGARVQVYVFPSNHVLVWMLGAVPMEGQRP